MVVAYFMSLSYKNWILAPRFAVAAASIVLFAGCVSAAAATGSIRLVASPVSGQSPLTVTFTATPSNLPFCGNTTTWDFGDGTASSSADSCAPYSAHVMPFPSITHTYKSAGTYVATLKMNLTTSNAVSVTVGP